MRLLIATHNRKKAGELGAILRQIPGVSLEDLTAYATDADAPEETADTFAGNSLIKARHGALLSGLTTLADDSGLCVAGLDGAPGVLSARLGGAGLSDSDRNRILLASMAHLRTPAERAAWFYCDICLFDPVNSAATHFTGRIDGYILDTPEGTGGFGYDPLFYAPTEKCTMAAMPIEIKNKISHRAQALAACARHLAGVLENFKTP